MRLVSLTDHRPASSPSFDLTNPQGQFYLTVDSYRLSIEPQKLPDDLQEWPDVICAAAVRALIQDLQEVKSSDRFYEAAAAYVGMCIPMADGGPWNISMGPLQLSLLTGAKDSTHEPASEPANPDKRYMELELEPDPGDPKLSSHPDVARTQAKEFWENQPQSSKASPPLYQQLTDAQFAGMVRNLHQQMLPYGLSSLAAFVAVGTALSMEAVMAQLNSEESEATFPNVKRRDGSATSVALMIFRQSTPTPRPIPRMG